MSDKNSPFSFLKTPVLSALAFVFTVVTVSVGYAAWTALDRNAAATGQTVTSSLMQAVIDDVNDLNSRLSNFSFSGGNVGIGTANPGAKLDIAAANPIVYLTSTGNDNARLKLYQGYNSYLTATNAMYLGVGGTDANAATILSNGNVGIGVATPSAKLEVNGIIARTGCPTGMVSAGPYCIDSAQRASATWNAASDACYAENKRLCNANEWASACRRNIFPRTGNWNWTDHTYALYWGATYYYYAATVIGSADCNQTSWSENNTTGNYPYRCCASRVL
jgi:hypothetical protein